MSQMFLDFLAGISAFNGALAFIMGRFVMEGMGDSQHGVLVIAIALLAITATYFLWRYRGYMLGRWASRKTRPILFYTQGLHFLGYNTGACSESHPGATNSDFGLRRHASALKYFHIPQPPTCVSAQNPNPRPESRFLAVSKT